MSNVGSVNQVLLSREQIFEKIQAAVAATTGMDPDEITLKTVLDDYDAMTIAQIIRHLNNDPDLKIHLEAKEVITELEEIQEEEDDYSFKLLLNIVEDTYRYDREEDDDDF